MTDPNRIMSPEFRARLISDEVGMGPIDQRKQRVFNAALEHIRAAEAIAANRARQELNSARPIPARQIEGGCIGTKSEGDGREGSHWRRGDPWQRV